VSIVAIFNSHTLWPVHYETELEIIQNHLNAGDAVYQIVCNGTINSCDLNLSNEPLECLRCIEKRKKGITLLNSPANGPGKLHVLEYHELTVQDKRIISATRFEYGSMDELKGLSVENFDIGLAVLSSIMSSLRDSSLDFSLYKETIDRHLQNALMVFYATKRIIDTYDISKFYVFNGRFAYPRAVFRACQQKSIECWFHEVGGTIYKYDIFKNRLPHNISYIQELIEYFWEHGEQNERQRLGRLWFEERIKAIPQNYMSFVAGQELTRLPESWNTLSHNVVIFNSSEDEMASIGAEWKNPLYKNQLDGIQSVVGDLALFPHIRVYLRMHPNLQGVNDDYVKSLREIKADNFELIEADSPVSTYQLIKRADKIVTFGSSTGIEAAYLSRVSILLGASYYKGKSCVYEPASHEEAIKMLADVNLEPIISDFPLKYGYYFKNRGIDFTFYKPTRIHDGTFGGVNLNSFRSLKFKIMSNRTVNRIARKAMGNSYRSFILRLART